MTMACAMILFPTALMESQVSDLKSRGIPAEFLSSTQETTTKEKIYKDINSRKPNLRLLYVTPELIATDMFLAKLKNLCFRGLLNLIAIDEAHCISSWGHDFRPGYRKLSILRRCFPTIPILALTATAARKVQEDVIQSLNLHQPVILRTSFNRPNIYYEVRYKDLLEDTYMDVLKLLKEARHECAIIYCLARNTCDEIGARLMCDGISSCVYHAGLSDKARSQALEDWTLGKVAVVVATIAFGMGIDKRDVRIVCHFNIPKSVESFYQESGRAGRDQKPSRSILYYGLQDQKSMAYILRNSRSSQKLESSKSIPSRKAIDDFESMIQYCEGSGCRRQKILAHFGEKVSTSLCAMNCDACRYPSRLAKDLDNLSQLCATRLNSCNPSILIDSSQIISKGCGEMESEFWNHDTESNFSGEDISESDDETSSISIKTMMDARVKNAKWDKKLDFLEHAEQEYNAKHRLNAEKKGGAKNMVQESFRDASRQRLENAVQQAFQRTGDKRSLDKDFVARSLESQCYRDYGKSGKSFYISGIANTVRWLSKSNLEDILKRIGHHRLHDSKIVSFLNPEDITPSTSTNDIERKTEKFDENRRLIGQKRAFPGDDTLC
eukprot:TRINITY_DN6343_c0_g1_i3.p1 TRINITY_DN6343_c0_g1~~TRINITY_DN6343_c0_g1_i3.p1  ORF type:complete len:610 (+),score=111.20 TRINITY_DN6343_c0_g1_i3:507-2336(+)